jgi:hypothetical protein
MQKTIGVGVSMPSNIISKIDAERGDISRSRFLLRLLERVYANSSPSIQTDNNEAQSKIHKPLQTDPRVGTSVNQSATDSMETASEGDSIHG